MGLRTSGQRFENRGVWNQEWKSSLDFSFPQRVERGGKPGQTDISRILWIAAAALTASIASSGTVFGQPKSAVPVELTSCSGVHRSGRRIVSLMEIVEFYIPRLAKMKKGGGVDFLEYDVRYGPERDNLWLKFMFGPMVGGHSPHDPGNMSIEWIAKKWNYHSDAAATDWIGTGPDDRRWRHIAFPYGFATYENAPPKAAAYFNRILDTMCCGERPYCKK